MTPVTSIARRGDEILLDRNQPVVMTLRRRRRARRGHHRRPARTHRRLSPTASTSRRSTGTRWSRHRPTIKLRAALEIRHRTGNPLALVEDGKLIGVIGDDEIYRGILRQTGIAG